MNAINTLFNVAYKGAVIVCGMAITLKAIEELEKEVNRRKKASAAKKREVVREGY